MSARDSEGDSCSPFTRYALDLQGFGEFSDAEKRAYALPMRFSPAVCTALVVAGTVLQWPVWQFAVAGMAIMGALFAKGHPVDAVYNYGVRYLFKANRLAANPRPRRFACLIVALMVTGSGLGFLLDVPLVGFVLGGGLAAVLALNSLTNWCLGTWMYRLLRLPA